MMWLDGGEIAQEQLHGITRHAETVRGVLPDSPEEELKLFAKPGGKRAFMAWLEVLDDTGCQRPCRLQLHRPVSAKIHSLAEKLGAGGPVWHAGFVAPPPSIEAREGHFLQSLCQWRHRKFHIHAASRLLTGNLGSIALIQHGQGAKQRKHMDELCRSHTVLMQQASPLLRFIGKAYWSSWRRHGYEGLKTGGEGFDGFRQRKPVVSEY